MLSIFVILTILFASLTLVEHSLVSTATTTSTIYTNTTTIVYTNTASTSTTCTNPPLVGCTPIDVPVLLSAFVNQSGTMTFCGVVTQGYPLAAVCDVTISEGVSGTVVLNLTSQNGDSFVSFGNYSSESAYVQFTSNSTCQSSPGCPVSTAGSVYRFDYTVAQILPAPMEAILTITVTKTCCWP